MATLLAICGACRQETPPAVDVPWQDPAEQIALLTDNDFRIRALAATNLGKLGAKGTEAIPKLEELLKDPHDKVRAAAQEAIEKIRNAKPD
jgi:HEAT repeat protein